MSQLQSPEPLHEEISEGFEDLELQANSSSETVDISEVEVETQVLGKRERLISAQLVIPSPCDTTQVWQILTNYEALPEFIPNLAVSRCLPHPEGKIRLEQVGIQRVLKINFKARVVLDLTEYAPHRIEFSMVEGDFQQFFGAWQLEEQKQTGVRLSYEVTVVPQRTLPIQLIENRICKDLPLNLLAIRQQALRQAGQTKT